MKSFADLLLSSVTQAGGVRASSVLAPLRLRIVLKLLRHQAQ